MIGRRLLLLASALLPFCAAYPTFTWPFEKLAEAPVIVTCVVQETHRDAALPQARTVLAHAILRVLRSFPPSTFSAGEQIRLSYVALPEGDLGMNGPDVAPLHPGDTLALPLKLNPEPAVAPWRLFADQGQGLTVPAIVATPPFAGPPRDGRAFLLREIATSLLEGTRLDMLSIGAYASGQKPLVPELMTLLESKLTPGDGRWSMIAAALLSSMGIPRPSVAELRGGSAGSLITAVLQKPVASTGALIHDLLVNSDIASWGVGVTVREFAAEPALIEELRKMLQDRSPGSLSVARDVLRAGQKLLQPDALTASLHYLMAPNAAPAELRSACWVIRDYGTDEQFARLVTEIRGSQYRDRPRYDALWRNVIWSDNPRERIVLDILLHDDRVYQPNLRYSQVANGEITRTKAK